MPSSPDAEAEAEVDSKTKAAEEPKTEEKPDPIIVIDATKTEDKPDKKDASDKSPAEADNESSDTPPVDEAETPNPTDNVKSADDVAVKANDGDPESKDEPNFIKPENMRPRPDDPGMPVEDDGSDKRFKLF